MNKWKIQKPYISVKQKLLGSYLILLIIPILLVGVYLTSSIRNNLISNKMEEIENNNERIRTDYVSILSSITSVSDWIYQDDDLAELVQTVYKSPFDVYQAYENYQMFEDYLRYYDEIEHIRFYVDNPTLTSTTGIYSASEEIMKTDWYQESYEQNGRIQWKEIEDPVTKKKHLNLIRAVYQDYEFVGILAIAVNEQVVKNILTDSVSEVFITLNQTTPVYSFPANDHMEKDYAGYLSLLKTIHSAEGNHNVADESIPAKEYTLNIREVQIPKTLNSQMQVIGIVPTESILKDVKKDLSVAYLIILSVLIISVLMLLLFLRTFNNRIIRLKEAMTMVANGQFSIPPIIKGNDELSDVYRQLGVTANSIEELMIINYDHVVREKNWELQIKDSQYKMLASQINPHFLYNTLEMIRMKALKNNDREVADIVKILSKLMRRALENREKYTKVKEELEFIQMYLKIQKLRFGDQIEYEMKDETDGNALILPLTIQPIVENSFIHGIEPKLGNGLIKIDICEDKENLIIKVIDNGVGIEKNKLESIKERLTSDESSDHIGINNVHQRIIHQYGDSFGLEIDSEINVGTIVTIKLPIHK